MTANLLKLESLGHAASSEAPTNDASTPVDDVCDDALPALAATTADDEPETPAQHVSWANSVLVF